MIPEGVKIIEKSAFAFCEKLIDITLPNSISKIEEKSLDNKYIKNINIFSYKIFNKLE